MKRLVQYCLSLLVGCGVFVGLSLLVGDIAHEVEGIMGSNMAAGMAALAVSSLASIAVLRTIFHTPLGDRFAHWLTTTDPFRQRNRT